MDQALDWIRSKAIPLASVTAGTGFADLAPLRGIIGDARIVSLGEATHGTREFFQLKHRLLEFCVAELGFTVFGIEANYPECSRSTITCSTARGDPAEALAGMRFWTWDTEEVLALIEWMRAWNRTHDRKVKFYGFDMQFPTDAALRAARLPAAGGARARRRQRGAALAARRRLLRRPLRPAFRRPHEMPHWPSIERMLDGVRAQRAAWIGATSELEWQLARMHAIVLEQSARLRLACPMRRVRGARHRDGRERAIAARDRGTRGEGRAVGAQRPCRTGVRLPRRRQTSIPNMGSQLASAVRP